MVSGGLPGVPYSGADELRDVTESEIQAAFDSVAPEAGRHLEFYEGLSDRRWSRRRSMPRCW